MRQFDAKGMKCPLPVLKARRLLREMAPGEQIEIEATDPGAPKDFVHFCETTGHKLVESRERDGVYVIKIEAVG
ncbi:sulfurtransferase TusA family protein [Dongia sp. agr-C8]